MPWAMLTRLGYRNLFRHGRRNLILLLSIMIAVAGVIFLNALLRGMQADLQRSARENLLGDFQVTAPGYLDDPQAALGFALSPEQIHQLDAQWPGRWSARLVVPVVIASERQTRGVNLVGISARQEAISFIDRARLAGDAGSASDPANTLAALELALDHGLVAGRVLLDDLDSRVGKRVVVTGQAADGLSQELGFRVAGAFDAEGIALERQYVFVKLGRLQAGLRTAAVSEVSVLLDDGEPVNEHRAMLARVFPGLLVAHWRERNLQVAALYDLMDVASRIWFAIVMVALGFGLVNALVTAVLERQREFGIMRCLGMRRTTVVAQILIESLLIMLAGVAGGILLGLILVSLTGGVIDLGRFAQGAEMAGLASEVSLHVTIADVAGVAMLSIVFGVLASLLPAWRANRIAALQAVAP